MSDTSRFDRHFAGLLKEYSKMSANDFEKIDKDGLTMEELMAYNYVSESRTNTKTADKVIQLIKWYEANSQWFIE